MLTDLFGCSDCDQLTAPISAFRTEVNDVICNFDDIQVVFNDDDRIAAIDQPLENFDQFMHICGMQAYGGFVQHI